MLVETGYSPHVTELLNAVGDPRASGRVDQLVQELFAQDAQPLTKADMQRLKGISISALSPNNQRLMISGLFWSCLNLPNPISANSPVDKASAKELKAQECPDKLITVITPNAFDATSLQSLNTFVHYCLQKKTEGSRFEEVVTQLVGQDSHLASRMKDIQDLFFILTASEEHRYSDHELELILACNSLKMKERICEIARSDQSRLANFTPELLSACQSVEILNLCLETQPNLLIPKVVSQCLDERQLEQAIRFMSKNPEFLTDEIITICCDRELLFAVFESPEDTLPILTPQILTGFSGKDQLKEFVKKLSSLQRRLQPSLESIAHCQNNEVVLALFETDETNLVLLTPAIIALCTTKNELNQVVALLRKLSERVILTPEMEAKCTTFSALKSVIKVLQTERASEIMTFALINAFVDDDGFERFINFVKLPNDCRKSGVAILDKTDLCSHLKDRNQWNAITYVNLVHCLGEVSKTLREEEILECIQEIITSPIASLVNFADSNIRSMLNRYAEIRRSYSRAQIDRVILNVLAPCIDSLKSLKGNSQLDLYKLLNSILSIYHDDQLAAISGESVLQAMLKKCGSHFELDSLLLAFTQIQNVKAVLAQIEAPLIEQCQDADELITMLKAMSQLTQEALSEIVTVLESLSKFGNKRQMGVMINALAHFSQRWPSIRLADVVNLLGTNPERISPDWLIQTLATAQEGLTISWATFKKTICTLSEKLPVSDQKEILAKLFKAPSEEVLSAIVSSALFEGATRAVEMDYLIKLSVPDIEAVIEGLNNIHQTLPTLPINALFQALVSTEKDKCILVLRAVKLLLINDQTIDDFHALVKNLSELSNEQLERDLFPEEEKLLQFAQTLDDRLLIFSMFAKLSPECAERLRAPVDEV